MTRAINSARLALFIHRITSAKRMREVRPALLVRESSTQLLMLFEIETHDDDAFWVPVAFCTRARLKTYASKL